MSRAQGCDAITRGRSLMMKCTQEESEAIVRLLLAGRCQDGVVSLSEGDEFRRQVALLPWSSEATLEFFIVTEAARIRKTVAGGRARVHRGHVRPPAFRGGARRHPRHARAGAGGGRHGRAGKARSCHRSARRCSADRHAATRGSRLEENAVGGTRGGSDFDRRQRRARRECGWDSGKLELAPPEAVAFVKGRAPTRRPGRRCSRRTSRRVPASSGRASALPAAGR
jgi:hypothetical protein